MSDLILTVLLVAAGLLCFGLFYRSVDFFENL